MISIPHTATAKEAELFERYIQVCNQSLEANKDRFPYKQIWETSERILKEKAIPVAIYDDHPKAIYHLKIKDHHIDAVDANEEDASDSWKINMSYLEEVAKHPEDYINNPAKIDWEWLRNRTEF